MHEKAKWRRENLRHFFAGNRAGKGFFYSVNVEGKGRCAALYRAASSDQRERP